MIIYDFIINLDWCYINLIKWCVKDGELFLMIVDMDFWVVLEIEVVM